MSAIAAIGEGLVELTPADPELRALTVSFGGDAANVAVMASRMGARVRMGGRVGADLLGDRQLAFWESEGVETSAVRRDPEAVTGLYLNETTSGGDHRFAYWRTGSAGSRLQPGDLEASFYDDLGILVITGVTLAVSSTSAAAAADAAARAREAGARVACVLNHRPALGGDPATLARLARDSDILIGSAEDAASLFGVSEPGELAMLLGHRPSEIVVTDGSRPALVATADANVRQAVPRVKVRNAAGAGDAVAGAYLAGRARELPLETCLAWGVAAATLSVQRDGCATAYPSADQTLALARQLLHAQRPSPVAS